MSYQAIFTRYELKYLLDLEQKQRILAAIAPHMMLDQYGRTTIRNLYFDTDSYRLIRRSIEKPAYKEKLRIRSYNRPDSDSPVFVELKKKFESVVYKRRLSMPQVQAMDWLCGPDSYEPATQISREIDYFRSFYQPLKPVVFLSYEREAYHCRDGSDFRVTFDDRILCRETELFLDSDAYGDPILQDGKVLMEIKCSGGIPLWMVQVLTREKVYKTPFSKYGNAYQQIIFSKIKEEKQYAGIHVSRRV